MSQALLTILGKIAHLARRTRLGSLLAAGRDSVDSVFLRVGTPPLRVEIGGLKIHGYLRHRSFLAGIATPQYEPFSRELYEKALRRDMIVVDGGAHIGLYSLLAARRLGSNAKILAFEPDPYNFQALVFNISKNYSSNSVIPIKKALSNSVREDFFYVSKGTISSSLFERRDIGEYQKILVQCTTIDRELQDLTEGSVIIKLDLEGAEILAIQGMDRLLQIASLVIMITEINPSALQKAGFSTSYMINALRESGFHVHFIDESNKRLIPVINSAITQKGNLYCVREN